MRSGRGDGHLRPPGFPIRTSSDHSLVADSPRLIAGSNVLHRLLVPRHPPCALHNLANTTDSDASRPLCSSQDTDGTKPAATTVTTGPSPAEVPGPAPSLAPSPVPSDTQQRAHPAPAAGSPFQPPRKRAVLAAARRRSPR